MAYMQQKINQEQEALNYLPAANEYYYDQYSRNDESRFILEKNSWKSIKQNNSSGKYLTDKELEELPMLDLIDPHGLWNPKDFLTEEFDLQLYKEALNLRENRCVKAA